MAEHEPTDIAQRDTGTDRSTPRRQAARRTTASDITAAASEPMELQRLPESEAHTPPGRQRTGDPPKSRD